MPDSTHNWSLSNIIGIVGGILFGVGIISLVASNWDTIPNFVKLALIIVLFVSLQCTGFWLKEYKKMSVIGLSVIIAGLLSYGAGIFLIGQIYNLKIEWSDGFLYWFLGCGLVAYLFNSKMIKYLSAIILGIGVLGHIGVFFYQYTYIANTYSDIQGLILLLCSGILAIMLAWQSRVSMPEEFQQYL